MIIFDFHKTLTDSVYFDQFDRETRELISDLIFRPPNNKLWDTKWMTGELAYSDILKYLASETSIPYDKLEESLFSSLENIQWNQTIWDFSQSVREKTRTAIATINTDLFRDFVVPQYRLDQKFDIITNSYDLKSNNKTELCIAAASELGLNIRQHRILLIDDKKKNVDEFISAGGEGFHYQSPNPKLAQTHRDLYNSLL